jgi:hypothetical protein
LSLAKWCVALILGVASLAHATIAHVQGNSVSVSTTTTASVTLGSSVTTGDTLIATATNSNNGQAPSGMSGCGTTWYLAPTFNGNNNVSVWYAANVPSGSCTVTVTFVTAAGINLLVDEYSGLIMSQYVLEIMNQPIQGRQNCCTSVSITTYGTNDLVYEVLNFANGAGSCSSPGSASPFTYRQSICSSVVRQTDVHLLRTV